MEAGKVVELLKGISPGVSSVESPRERKVQAEVAPASIKSVVEVLVKNDARFIIIAAVDSGLDVELHYHFSIGGTVAVLKAKLPKENLEIDSVTGIIPGIEWAEREAAEFTGAKFKGHPNPEHLVLPEDWQEGNFPFQKPFKRLPDEVSPVAESVATVGATAPMTELMERKRQEAGLPVHPPMSYSIDSQLKEINDLIKSSGFVERAGYDLEKKKLRGVKK